MRPASGALGLSLVLACAAPRAVVPPPAGTKPPLLEIRLVSSGRDCLGQTMALGDVIDRELDAIGAALSAQGMVVGSHLVEPTARELVAAIGAEAHGSILWLYSGHGDLVHPETRTVLTNAEKQDPLRIAISVLCLADGPMPVADAVRALPASAPFALMIVNACFSADVDVRVAPVDMSLLSLSTWRTKIDGHHTPLGEALLATTVGALDRDCDGDVSDLELFAHLRDQFVNDAYGEPILKLRRQIQRLPVLARASRCEPGMALDRQNSELRVEPYRHFGASRLWVTGFIPPGAPLAVESRAFQAQQLQATSCRADIGQCFQPITPF